jgi:hypothetical protein
VKLKNTSVRHPRLLLRSRCSNSPAMAKQHEQNENDDNNPDDAMATTTIVAATIAPIASPAAKKQDNQDDENEKTHGSSVFGTPMLQKRACPAVVPLGAWSERALVRPMSLVGMCET